jgi:L-serine dehydratase
MLLFLLVKEIFANSRCEAMIISAFDMFSIGIGPSSSHTVGTMRATYTFISELRSQLEQIQEITIDLYGSLALTGIGHGTDKAVLMGLEGNLPEKIDPQAVLSQVEAIKRTQILTLLGTHPIKFNYLQDLRFHKNAFLPRHANALSCTAYNNAHERIAKQTYYSIGGGFILNDANFSQAQPDKPIPPYPFASAAELMQQCQHHQLSIAALMWVNESTWRSAEAVERDMLAIAQTIFACIDQGCRSTQSYLPGSLQIKRRAPQLFLKLQQTEKSPQEALNWINLYALAVNEENAAGGRVVTAPTNGQPALFLQY